MTRLKIQCLRMVVLLFLQTFWVQTSYSEPLENPKFKEEVSKQTAIYQSRGHDVPEGYVIGRSLLSYGIALPPEFHGSLAALGPNDRWLDIGAGEGRAILDYCTSKYDVMHPQKAEHRGKKAKAVAMSIEDRRTPRWEETAASLEPNQIQYLFGKPLGEYSLNELGKFQVITDVLGGFSYTRRLSFFMEKTLGLLEVNGSFYTVLQDVHSEKGTNRPYYPDASFLTELTKADGSEMKMCSWLKSISCVEVTCDLKADWTPPIESYHVRKVCDNVTVPALTPTHFEAGTPPERRFRLSTPLPASVNSTNATR